MMPNEKVKQDEEKTFSDEKPKIMPRRRLSPEERLKNMMDETSKEKK